MMLNNSFMGRQHTTAAGKNLEEGLMSRRIAVKLYGIDTPVEVNVPPNVTVNDVVNEVMRSISENNPDTRAKINDLRNEGFDVVMRVGNTVQSLDRNTRVGDVPDGAIIEVQPRLQFG